MTVVLKRCILTRDFWATLQGLRALRDTELERGLRRDVSSTAQFQSTKKCGCPVITQICSTIEPQHSHSPRGTRHKANIVYRQHKREWNDSHAGDTKLRGRSRVTSFARPFLFARAA